MITYRGIRVEASKLPQDGQRILKAIDEIEEATRQETMRRYQGMYLAARRQVEALSPIQGDMAARYQMASQRMAAMQGPASFGLGYGLSIGARAAQQGPQWELLGQRGPYADL